MTNKDLWDGIMNLAKSLNMSCSGLACFAGLNATTFNKSKRVNKNGLPRWPSTHSLVRVLNAANMTLCDFERFLPCNFDKNKKDK